MNINDSIRCLTKEFKQIQASLIGLKRPYEHEKRLNRLSDIDGRIQDLVKTTLAYESTAPLLQKLNDLKKLILQKNLEENQRRAIEHQPPITVAFDILGIPYPDMPVIVDEPTPSEEKKLPSTEEPTPPPHVQDETPRDALLCQARDALAIYEIPFMEDIDKLQKAEISSQLVTTATDINKKLPEISDGRDRMFLAAISTTLQFTLSGFSKEEFDKEMLKFLISLKEYAIEGTRAGRTVTEVQSCLGALDFILALTTTREERYRELYEAAQSLQTTLVQCLKPAEIEEKNQEQQKEYELVRGTSQDFTLQYYDFPSN